MNDIEIIPVTHVLRNFLDEKEKNREEIINYDFDIEDYEYFKLKLNIKAIVNNKSDIWVYQELIRHGYGNFIDRDDDMYKMAKLAYDDVKRILNTEGEVGAIVFENVHVLFGNEYKDKLKNTNKKVLKR